MRQHQDLAIVLKRINYGERDRILTLLCREQGKISVLAKGVRAEKSKLAGGIELLSESEVSLVEGRSELMTLTGSRLRRHFGGVVSDSQRLEQVFRYLKLLHNIIDERAGQEYYPVLLAAFEAIDNNSYDPHIIDIWLQMRVLQLHGSSPNLRASSGEIFEFDYDKQQFVPAETGIFSQNDIKLLRLCQKTSKPPKIEQKTGSEESLAKFMRNLIQINLSDL